MRLPFTNEKIAWLAAKLGQTVTALDAEDIVCLLCEANILPTIAELEKAHAPISKADSHHWN